MTHDPYQTYQSFGAYSGLTNPFTSPYAAMQTNPFVGNVGMPWAAQSALQNPFIAALLHQPGIGLQNVLQNPLQNQLQNQLLNPVVAQIAQQAYQQALLQQAYQQQQPYQQQLYQQHPYQQIGHMGQPFAQQAVPFGQFNNPFIQSAIAPQSWVGQGQGQGQINPLVLQSLARTLQPQGISPWGQF